jgi:hypothetical protein
MPTKTGSQRSAVTTASTFWSPIALCCRIDTTDTKGDRMLRGENDHWKRAGALTCSASAEAANASAAFPQLDRRSVSPDRLTPALGVQFAEPLDVSIRELTRAFVFLRLSSIGGVCEGRADYLRTVTTCSAHHCAGRGQRPWPGELDAWSRTLTTS